MGILSDAPGPAYFQRQGGEPLEWLWESPDWGGRAVLGGNNSATSVRGSDLRKASLGGQSCSSSFVLLYPLLSVCLSVCSASQRQGQLPETQAESRARGARILASETPIWVRGEELEIPSSLALSDSEYPGVPKPQERAPRPFPATPK